MSTAAERLAPHNLEAEKAVLGAVLLDSSLFNQAAQVLRADDFYLESHRRVFRAFAAISEKGAAEAIDMVTLREALAREGSLEDAGGAAYLSSLIDGLPRYSNIEHYARIVKDKSLLRRLIDAGTRIVNEGFLAEEDTRTIIDRAQSAIFGIADEGMRGSGFVSIEELAAPTLEKLAKMVDARSGVTGMPTGFMDFDNITAGLQSGDLIVLASRPGMGKTSLATNAALHVGRVGGSVGLFSLEMNVDQLFVRMVCSEARVNSQRVRTGRISDEEFKRLAPRIDAFMRYKVFIDDTPALSLMETRAKARRLKAEHGLQLLIIDYLQLMTTERRFENRNLEIGHITHGLKALAKELQVPILALSQLSRAPESRSGHRPMLADLRESGNIEQDADLVCFLFREEYYNATEENAGLADLIISKNRNGPVGTVQLVFFSEFTRFQDYAPVEEE